MRPRLGLPFLGLPFLGLPFLGLAALGALLGCSLSPALGPSCGPVDLAPLPATPRFALVRSDYSSTAIALLDAQGGEISGAWLHSGTTPAGIATTLSGDVVLPSRPPGACRLGLLDRFGSDTLTLLNTCSAENEAPLVAQLRLHVPPSAGRGAYYANPYDLALTSEGRAFVSRFEPNLDPDAEELDRGNDLVEVDLTRGVMLGRVPLSALDRTVGGETLYARPARLLRLRSAGGAERLLAGLAGLSLDFMRAGEGRLALIDPASGEVEAFPLEGLANCGELRPVPGAPAEAIATCVGQPFEGDEVRRAQAGVAWIGLSEAGAPELLGLYRASAPLPGGGEAPVPGEGTVPLGGDRVLLLDPGDPATRSGDRVFLLELSSGRAEALLTAGAAFVLGSGAFDPQTRAAFLPDASARVLHRLEVEEGGGVAVREPIDLSGCTNLPPRELRILE